MTSLRLYEFYFSMYHFIAATEHKPVSLWPLGGARNGLERREGINRPEGGQGRPWPSWPSCKSTHVAIFHNTLVLSVFFPVWFNMVVQISSDTLIEEVQIIIALKTHPKCKL